jgi:hypothetical protein
MCKRFLCFYKNIPKSEYCKYHKCPFCNEGITTCQVHSTNYCIGYYCCQKPYDANQYTFCYKHQCQVSGCKNFKIVDKKVCETHRCRWLKCPNPIDYTTNTQRYCTKCNPDMCLHPNCTYNSGRNGKKKIKNYPVCSDHIQHYCEICKLISLKKQFNLSYIESKQSHAYTCDTCSLK